MEDEIQNQILLTDYNKRLTLSKDFFANNTLKDTQFLAKNNIKYIYLPKIYGVSLDNLSTKIEEIFQNNEAVIFKVLNE